MQSRNNVTVTREKLVRKKPCLCHQWRPACVVQLGQPSGSQWLDSRLESGLTSTHLRCRFPYSGSGPTGKASIPTVAWPGSTDCALGPPAPGQQGPPPAMGIGASKRGPSTPPLRCCFRVLSFVSPGAACDVTPLPHQSPAPPLLLETQPPCHPLSPVSALTLPLPHKTLPPVLAHLHPHASPTHTASP